MSRDAKPADRPQQQQQQQPEPADQPPSTSPPTQLCASPLSTTSALPDGTDRPADADGERKEGAPPIDAGDGADDDEKQREKRLRRAARHKRRPSSQHRVKETMDAIASEGEDGRRTVNQYRLGPVLGQGAYGKVELGVDVQTGLTFAVKEYSKSRLRKQIMERSVRERRGAARGGGTTGLQPPPHMPRWMGEDNPLTFISREVAIMKKLDHPNLIHLYEVLDVPLSDGLFMVLEFCPGGTLLEMPCPTKPPMSAAKSKHYFSQLCLGLEYLHSNGVVHRDIKPENILLSMDGETAKFCDFGVSDMFSKSGDSKVNKGNGSPAFMPPECTVSGDVLLPNAIDIWSLGVTLYVMLTGDLPFESDNPLDLFDSIRDDPVPIPAEWPDAQKDIVRRMMEKDPEKRITMDEIRAHPYLEGVYIPSKEENLADERMVGEPSPEELRGAIRSISSAFAVIRAVQKFRKLAQRNRPPTPSPSSTCLSFESDSSLAPISRLSSPRSSPDELPHANGETRTLPARQSTSASSLQVPDMYDEPEDMDDESPADPARSGSFISDEPEEMGDGGAQRSNSQIGPEMSDEPESFDADEEADISHRLNESSVRDATPGPPQKRSRSIPPRRSPLSPAVSRQSSLVSSADSSALFTTPPTEDEPEAAASQQSQRTVKPSRPAVDTSSLAAPETGHFGIVVESPGGGREELR